MLILSTKNGTFITAVPDLSPVKSLPHRQSFLKLYPSTKKKKKKKQSFSAKLTHA